MFRGDGIGIGGNKESIVFEACEYKNNFLNLSPKECILTNIDFDHTDFFKNKKAYINSFQKFLSKAGVIRVSIEGNWAESALSKADILQKEIFKCFIHLAAYGERDEDLKELQIC